MRRGARILLLLFAAFFLSSWEARTQGRTQEKTPSSGPAASGAKQPARRPAASNPPRRSSAPSTRSRRTATRRRPAATPAAGPAQIRPTRERYAQIQTALAQAGYFQEPANGNWGTSSVNALAYFQKDHGLEPTGKIDAPSLIRLGLGPKYETPTQARGPNAGPPQ